ncbi:MAG: glycoside hydrolase family 15 protein [Vicinamibacterales bacterium]
MSWAPLRPIDGYLPIEDHGLIGDGTTAALVARDGSVVWLCTPRFDSPPLFCALLDTRRGGEFAVTVEGLRASRQRYETDSGVLVTEMQGPSGVLQLTDALALRDGADLAAEAAASRSMLLRRLAVVDGHVAAHVRLRPRGGATVTPWTHGLRVRVTSQPADLHLSATVPVTGLATRLDLGPGDVVFIALEWGEPPTGVGADAGRILSGTTRAWQRWAEQIEYEGPQRALVRRSAITLKLLDHFENGAIVAAPTSSLPEAIGGPRNWDYRFAWIRDTAFSVYALHRIGLRREAGGFLRWALHAFEQSDRPLVLYGVDGAVPAPEREDPDLEGYRGSAPVRWGNGAADQRQHDVFGEVLDCAYQFARRHGRLDPDLWRKLQGLVERSMTAWNEPDHGIWEVRTPGRVFTYSAAMCLVALDRGARLAAEFNLPGDVEAWQAATLVIQRRILEDAWDPARLSLTEHLGGGGLDASLLSLPLRRVLAADNPRMVATTEAIRARLGAGNGLLYRYLPDESPDGLPGHEGAFLLCSFWLVDNLAKQGRLDEAASLYDSLCGRANGLGLLPEQIDPGSGAFLGNFPQAFSHVGVISSGVNLASALRRQNR